MPRGAATLLLWIVFFGSSAYGHVALKVAVDAKPKQLFGAMVSPLALSAYLAWGVSALLWGVVLSRHSLFGANAISALRYVAVAACAAWFLREPVTVRLVAGAALIVVGVLLVGKA